MLISQFSQGNCAANGINSMQLEFTNIELVNRSANGAILFERVQLRSELLK